MYETPELSRICFGFVKKHLTAQVAKHAKNILSSFPNGRSAALYPEGD